MRDANGDCIGCAREQRAQRAAGDVDLTAAPACQDACTGEARSCGRARASARSAAPIAGEIDERILERDAAGLEMAAARHAPGVEGDDQPLRTQQRRPARRLTELDILEQRFRTVPAPAHRKAVEADFEPGLMTYQLLERRTLLWHTRRCQPVGDQQQREQCECPAEREQGRAQRRSGAARSSASGAARGLRGSWLGWRSTHQSNTSDEYDVVLINAV